MKMKSRVRVVYEVETEHDIPEPEMENVQRADRPDDKEPGQEMVNESKVEKARVKAAKDIEKQVKALYPDALEIVVEEVTESG